MLKGKQKYASMMRASVCYRNSMAVFEAARLPPDLRILLFYAMMRKALLTRRRMTRRFRRAGRDPQIDDGRDSQILQTVETFMRGLTAAIKAFVYFVGKCQVNVGFL
jgi:hypothetical protein